MRASGNAHGPKRAPDHIREEIIDVLLGSDMLEFNTIFMRVVESLKKKSLSTGGEEILRLRIYEKLQALVALGALKKKGKEYTELPKLSEVKGITDDIRRFI
ncbi:MAG: hypothetical protein RR250_07330 [Akkermansia sp.]